ncbi:dynein intermediate chain CFAP94, axonemal [Rana temporaria]|uniref:dynein intermediate chain CFAP94, axonemal n=1 Tax=Rana temporaria TaxID=8407 RepID=UPI001AAD9B91|nr:dynein intermediate chain CFAP94, axonemal [Rana temporaria]
MTSSTCPFCLHGSQRRRAGERSRMSSKVTSATSQKKGTSSATSQKKGKPSKTEKLRLQKEEEERKQREEEEAYLLAEQIEAARLEKERLEREAIERLEAKQLEHREEELGEYRLLIDEKLEDAARWKKDLRTRAKWDRYMLCDGSPDPSVCQEINTFMSLWSEETKEDFQSVLNKSNQVLRLIEELEFFLHDTPAEDLPEGDAAQYAQTVQQLQNLLQQKFDEATEHLLKNAAALSDIDTGNMQNVIANKNVKLCIWANLNKNPRFRGYKFEEEGISFDLPKPLALSNIAVRILHTSYDHLSCQSPTFQPHIREAEENKAEETLRPESGIEEWKPTEEEEEEKPEPGNVAAMEDDVQSEGRKSTLSSMSQREDPEKGAEPQENHGAEADQTTESQPGDITEGQPPSPVQDQPTPNDLLEDDVVDLRQFLSLGGVYYFDVLVLPPQCKQVNGWSMVQLVEGGLQNQPYPQESLLSTSLGLSLQEKDLEGLSSPPVGVSIKVPNDVIFFEEPQVARWDPESKNWKTDVIMSRSYNMEQRLLSFKMDAFHTFTLFQEAYLNMPYESWELKPNGMNEVSLTVTSAFTDIHLEIKDDQCRLAAVSSTDGDLSALLGKWMSPLSLRDAMKRVGLNFFPAEDSPKYVSVNKKSEQVEKMAYKEMALLSPSFALGWSKWNLNCSHEQIVVKVRECRDSSNDDDWSLYLLSPLRTQRLKISESDDTFSDDLYDGSEFHSTLYHMIKDYSSPDAIDRLKHSHHLFVDCVHQLLSMTKVLTYS